MISKVEAILKQNPTVEQLVQLYQSALEGGIDESATNVSPTIASGMYVFLVQAKFAKHTKDRGGNFVDLFSMSSYTSKTNHKQVSLGS